MDARERFSEFLAGQGYTGGVPAAFFQHFAPGLRHGQAALEAQLGFFEATGMDMLKIMFDDIYPQIPGIHSPADWARIPTFRRSDPVFTQQIDLARQVVERAGKKAYVFQTIFTPYVSAGCSVSGLVDWDEIISPHLLLDPEAVCAGLQKICGVLAGFAQDLAATGIDGFYVSVQGGERARYPRSFFRQWLKPIDLAFLNALRSTGKLVFIHFCGVGMRLEEYLDYPGDVVNLAVHGNGVSLAGAAGLFRRPVMGGLDNTGVICTGTEAQIRAEVERTLRAAPAGVMLGADCTIPREVPAEHLRWAVEAAHAFRG